MATDRVQPNAQCVPCQKEIVCSQGALALIQSGHALMLMGSWRAADLDRWNDLLYRFEAEARELLSAGPMGAPGDSLAVDAERFDGHSPEEWENLLREGADSFIAWAADLPPEERAEALRHGRDTLAHKAVELAGARRGMTLADLAAEQLHARRPPGLPLGMGA